MEWGKVERGEGKEREENGGNVQAVDEGGHFFGVVFGVLWRSFFGV